jgi:prepilin peptidase CpaA
MFLLDAPLTTALVAILVVAAVIDLRERRIPNALTVGALMIALALRGSIGAGAVVDGLLGAVLALVLLLPLFALGGVGGGDAKLLVAVGAFLGRSDFFVALLAIAVAGGVLALAYAARRGVILPALLNTKGLLLYVFTLGRSGERTTLATQGAVSIPYGLAIAAGTLFALWYRAGPGLAP